MIQMPPDSIVDEESFKKVMEHIHRDRIMISGVDAARLVQTYLLTEKEREDAKSQHKITSNKIRRNLERTKTRAAKTTRVKATKMAKPKTRRGIEHRSVK